MSGDAIDDGRSAARYRCSRWLLGLLLAWACFTRFHDLDGMNLWHDEAWVAVSVAQPTVRGMIFDFEYPQTSPPLFLLLVRTLAAWLGHGDTALRLVAATAGTLCAAVLWLLARKLTRNELTAFLALALYISNPKVLRYCQELKQYATDALVAVVLLYLTEIFLEQTDLRRRVRWGWLLTGATMVCLALSYTAALVVPAIALRWLWDVFSTHESRVRRRELFRLGAYVGLALTVFASVYLIFVRPQLRPWLVDFWAGRYLSDHSIAGFLRFAIEGSYSLFHYLFDPWDSLTFGVTALLAAVSFVVCIVVLGAKRDVAAMVYLTVPFLTTLTVASFGRYPYGGIRTSLFLVPLLMIGIARGMATPLMWLEKKRAGAGWVLTVVAVLSLQAVELSYFGLGYPKRNEDVRSAVADLRERREDPDFVAVDTPGFYAYRHYAGDAAGRFREFGGWDEHDLDRGREELDRIIDDDVTNGRLWLVFARDRGGREAMIAHVDRRCNPVLRREYENALLVGFSCPD